jgi:hypothetical protein
MPKTKRELPDVDPETLNAMIRDLARDMGCPHWAYSPDLVELGEIPTSVYGYNAGCTPSGVEMYREGQRWRRKALEELQRRSEWVAQWLADAEMDRRIEELCAAKGLVFYPWEAAPWQVTAEGDPPPPRDHFHCWADSVPLAHRLRRELEAELSKNAK